ETDPAGTPSILCDVGDLDPGASIRIHLRFGTDPGNSGDLVFSANAGSNTSDPNARNNSANASSVVRNNLGADIQVTISAPSTALVDGCNTGSPLDCPNRFNVEIDVTNLGPGTAHGVQDPDPSSFTSPPAELE